MKILLAFAMLAPSLSPHMEADTTGQMKLSSLQKICMATDEPNQSACQSYITGVVEGVEIYAQTTDDKTHICLPHGAPPGQTVQLVKDMMQKDLILYPADGEIRAASFVLQTIEHFFPCPKSTNGL